MSELLLELFSEEIPARMQGKAAADLKRLVEERLFAAGLTPEGAAAFATPRRLTLVVTGLPGRSPDRREEKKGPRVGAPEKAVEGFLRSAGLASLDQCERREDKKGEYWVAVIDEPGRATADIIAEAAPEIVRSFPWPKSMRWGDGDLRWVRPLKSILCTYEAEVVPFEVAGMSSGDVTYGHRCHAPEPIRARTFEDYREKLAAARVTLDAAERRETILAEARTLCSAQGLELVEDAGLAEEVAGLCEAPVVLMGAFDEKFLGVPDEALTASMRGHQKYFSVRDPSTGRLANRFVFVANLEAPDGGAAMRVGYERVLTARLSDAWFLYRQDLKARLEDRLPALDKITFFEGLGTVGEKARRIAALAQEIAPHVGADPVLAKRAGLLAKADLTAGMVYEFPELQGVMGRYYALEQGEPAEVADAIRDHYKPAGQGDDVPSAPVSAAVALADKIDTLAAFWGIDQKPTGSKDPFALRRAALGVIAIILKSEVPCRLGPLITASFWQIASTIKAAEDQKFSRFVDAVLENSSVEEMSVSGANPELDDFLARWRGRKSDLLAFFHDRLKVWLKDQGRRHDRVDAVLTNAAGALEYDLVLIVKKLDALDAFLESEDGANLLAAHKRAGNILKAEEKKGWTGGAAVDPALLEEPAEKALRAAMKEAGAAAAAAVEKEDFAGAMTALARLRAPLDAFFDAVTVNAGDAMLRANRLALLEEVRAACRPVADLAKLEG